MSIDLCQKCDKRLDTDFVEYQEDGTLLCDGCLDEMENEQEPDWKALAGELAEALEHLTGPKVCWCEADTKDSRLQFHAWECNTAKAALAKYEQEKGV
jgi:hypothetical protein